MDIIDNMKKDEIVLLAKMIMRRDEEKLNFAPVYLVPDFLTSGSFCNHGSDPYVVVSSARPIHLWAVGHEQGHVFWHSYTWPLKDKFDVSKRTLIKEAFCDCFGIMYYCKHNKVKLTLDLVKWIASVNIDYTNWRDGGRKGEYNILSNNIAFISPKYLSAYEYYYRFSFIIKYFDQLFDADGDLIVNKYLEVAAEGMTKYTNAYQELTNRCKVSAA
jgi:hypothetical protein